MSRRQHLSDQSNLNSPGRDSVHYRKRAPRVLELPTTASPSPRRAALSTRTSFSDHKQRPLCRHVSKILMILGCCLAVGLTWTMTLTRRALYPQDDSVAPSWSLLFPIHLHNTTTTQSSFHIPMSPIYRSHRPNYGGLRDAPNGFSARIISSRDDERLHAYRIKLLDLWDASELDAESDQEKALRSDPSRYEHYDEIDWHASSCRRPKWSFDTHLNCNSLHEVRLPQFQPNSLQQLAIKYLSEGSFRMAWLLQEQQQKYANEDVNAITDTTNTVVMKNLRLALDVNALTIKQVHLEALVMSQTLDSSSTADIYGHCGTSILVETGQSMRNSVFYSQSLMDAERLQRKQQEFHSTSLNLLTDAQRLKLAVSMAESLAVMHGNPNGVIVNDDLQVFQWVVCHDGNIKLNDFNNAIVMEWNDEQRKYCPFTGDFDSVYRSPQENSETPTDESADVHVLGSMYYNLLTGLMPFYHKKSYSEGVKALVEQRETPYIDPAFRNGTLVQRALVEIMEDCWHYESEGRPSVFSVLERLRATVVAYEKEQPGMRIKSVDLRPLGRPL